MIKTTIKATNIHIEKVTQTLKEANEWKEQELLKNNLKFGGKPYTIKQELCNEH